MLLSLHPFATNALLLGLKRRVVSFKVQWKSADLTAATKQTEISINRVSLSTTNAELGISD